MNRPQQCVPLSRRPPALRNARANTLILFRCQQPEPELDPTLFNFPLDHEHDIAINPPPVFPPPPPPVVADVKRGRGRPKGSKVRRRSAVGFLPFI